MNSVLVVDDSKFARRNMRIALEEMGFAVEEAANGTEAVSRYSPERHRLVTLDLLMPGMDGTELLTKLREVNSAAKILVATADIQLTTRRTVESLGATAIINKPIQREDLKRVVKAILEGSVTSC